MEGSRRTQEEAEDAEVREVILLSVHTFTMCNIRGNYPCPTLLLWNPTLLSMFGSFPNAIRVSC